jgi:hypothetical protein
MTLLSVGAAYGVMALFAGGGWFGSELLGIDKAVPVAPFIPVMMFAILFGLSMRPGQVCVQNPPPSRAWALDDLVDRLDRVVAAAAGPKPVGLRLEPGLPLGFQRVERTRLVHAVNDDRNS